MRHLLAVMLCCATLASAEDVTRTVVFKTTPPDATIVQMVGGQHGTVGTAGVEMEVRVALDGNNVSARPLEFEATLPGHKPLQFKMDTRGPNYNMNVNAPIEYVVVEHLQPDGSLSGGVDYVRANPTLVLAALGTLAAGLGAGVYAVRYKKTQEAEAAAAVAARPDPKSYLDHQLEAPAPAAPPAAPPPVPETDSYLDHQLPPPDYATPQAEPAPEPVKEEPAAEPPVPEPAAEEPEEAGEAAPDGEKKGKKKKK